MKEVYKSLVLLSFLMILSPLYGQKAPMDSLYNPSYLSFNMLQYKPQSKPSILYNTGFKANELPIFCKMEHQLQLQSRFPVRIRLGDVRYVNKLESKN